MNEKWRSFVVDLTNVENSFFSVAYCFPIDVKQNEPLKADFERLELFWGTIFV